MEIDYVLSLALTVYEAGLCSCGQPMSLAHHPDNDGWYNAHKTQCHSCAARELATKGNGTTPYEPRPGEKLYTTYNRPKDRPLPPASSGH
jgi:hypothetical protein